MATHIKDVLVEFLKKAKKKGAHYKKIEEKVDKFVGGEAGNGLKRKEFKQDEIMLYFKSSAFIYEFNLKKEQLLKELQKDFPEIKKIITKIG